MGKIKYSEEMKLQTVKYVLEGGKSATKVSKELGIDTNTVCRWVREYREANQMPSYESEQRIMRQSADQMANKIKELEKEFSGNGRVLIRPSGTEPVVRVMIEGQDKNVIEAEATKLCKLIEKYCK